MKFAWNIQNEKTSLRNIILKNRWKRSIYSQKIWNYVWSEIPSMSVDFRHGQIRASMYKNKFSLRPWVKKMPSWETSHIVFCGYHYHQKWDGWLEFSYPKAIVIVTVKVPSNRLFSIVVDDSSPKLSLKQLWSSCAEILVEFSATKQCFTQDIIKIYVQKIF